MSSVPLSMITWFSQAPSVTPALRAACLAASLASGSMPLTLQGTPGLIESLCPLTIQDCIDHVILCKPGDHPQYLDSVRHFRGLGGASCHERVTDLAKALSSRVLVNAGLTFGVVRADF